MAEENKAVVHRYFTEVINAGRTDRADACVIDDERRHMPGAEGRQSIEVFRLESGKMTERQATGDALGVPRQLGIMPLSGPTLPARLPSEEATYQRQDPSGAGSYRWRGPQPRPRSHPFHRHPGATRLRPIGIHHSALGLDLSHRAPRTARKLRANTQ
jgi:hypothetical protein